MFGIVKNETGELFKKDNYKVVKKIGKKGEIIPTHNHENEEIVFSLISGNVVVSINSSEKYTLNPGDILNFDGQNTISVEFIEDSEIVITLINK